VIYQDQILAEARKWVGVHEVPMGSNDGPEVRQLQSVTGAYHAPWCASFVQAVLRWSRYGTIANDSAGAYYIGNWCENRGWKVTRPQPADIVVFYHGSGHIGIVDEPAPSGFYSIEGNTANECARRFHSFDTPCRFFRLSNVRPRPRKVWLPRFEAVGSHNGHEVVLFKWGKWAKLAPLIPKLLARGYSVRVRRKLVKTMR